MNTLERALIEKTGQEQGWENVLQRDADAVILGSARHRGQAHISLIDGSFRITLPGGLLAQELRRSFPDIVNNAGIYEIPQQPMLGRFLRRAAELLQSLPDQAAQTYKRRVQEELSKTDTSATEIYRLVKQRVGQETFREALMDYWGGACAVTGIAVPEVLRASHTKPWSECETDEQRLDVYNGFLLCANLDALFDRKLITFDESGKLVASRAIPAEDRVRLNLEGLQLRWIAPEHQNYLNWHRDALESGGDMQGDVTLH